MKNTLRLKSANMLGTVYEVHQVHLLNFAYLNFATITTTQKTTEKNSIFNIDICKKWYEKVPYLHHL